MRTETIKTEYIQWHYDNRDRVVPADIIDWWMEKLESEKKLAVDYMLKYGDFSHIRELERTKLRSLLEGYMQSHVHDLKYGCRLCNQNEVLNDILSSY